MDSPLNGRRRNKGDGGFNTLSQTTYVNKQTIVHNKREKNSVGISERIYLFFPSVGFCRDRNLLHKVVVVSISP